ncbi:MAG: nucleotide sugar dehydrogenase [Acidobacteriota bacterium]
MSEASLNGESAAGGEALPARVEQWIERLGEHRGLVGILGLGYVGLPLGLAFAEAGFQVLGFDVDPEKVETLQRGECYIEHLEASRIASARRDDRLTATSDFDRLGEPDALLICVPTPLDRFRQPNLDYVESTAREISRRLRPGQLVVLESTTYPGTTDDLLRRTLDASGLECGSDYYLAFSPEREDPGNLEFGTTGIPKVIGGLGQAATRMAEVLYRDVFTGTVTVSSTRAAEATKLTENIFRAVNIALVNELKVVYDAMGIDVWEVLDAAATKPFGFMRFTPGPGWGGHCIPVDPFYLSWKAREFGQTARFVELAGEVNIEMPRYVVGKLQNELNKRTLPMRGSRVLLLGLAYKPDIADPRESPAFEILELLHEAGAETAYHDPYIPKAPSMRTWPELPPLESVPLDAETLKAQDAVLVVTNHRSVDYGLVLEHAPLILDTRGVYRGGSALEAKKVVKA